MTERPYFLTDEEMRQLTGWAMKSRQIQWLKAQAIPFRVSATGHPVVVRSFIESQGERPPQLRRRAWAPHPTEA